MDRGRLLDPLIAESPRFAELKRCSRRQLHESIRGGQDYLLHVMIVILFAEGGQTASRRGLSS